MYLRGTIRSVGGCWEGLEMNFRADWEPSVLWWTLAVLAVQGGLLAEEASALLREFFRVRRQSDSV